VIDRGTKLAVENAGSAVATAQVRLDQERAEGTVARQEWNQLHPNEEPSSPLVVRQPQIRQAEALLQAATAQLAKANLDLERTTIAMPFPGDHAEERGCGAVCHAGAIGGGSVLTEVVRIVIPLETASWRGSRRRWGSQSRTTGVRRAPEATVLADFEGRGTRGSRVVRTQGRSIRCRGWLRLLWR
jgi:hypothetical protein